MKTQMVHGDISMNKITMNESIRFISKGQMVSQ